MKHSATVKYWKDQSSPWVVTWRQADKRQVRYFKSEKEAKEFAQEKTIELRREGNAHSELSQKERRAVLLARDRGIDLEEAVDYYNEHLATLRSSSLVEAAVDEFLTIREAGGNSVRHVDDLRQRLGKFAQSFGQRSVASINTRELDQWLFGLAIAAQTRANFRRIIHNFFAFCEGRGYCPTNPATKMVKIKVPPKEIGILTVREAHRLLSFSGEIVPAVAIGMFAGLRREEIARLDWADVDLDRRLILVKASKSKTAARRHVEISDNLHMWLTPFRADSGPVRVPNYRKMLERAAALAGIKAWPHNALRHSFASYHLACHENAAKTGLELGHTESRTLFTHYRELVKPEDAKAFWQIFPPDCTKPLTLVAA
jgi:integrase